MTNTYQITMATEADASAILSLYKAQIGREFCAWDEDYPSAQTIDFDLSRDALFVLKIEGQIKAAISLEVDEAVDTLPCWTRPLPLWESWLGWRCRLRCKTKD